MVLRDRERKVAKALRRFLIAKGRSCSWRPAGDPPDFVFYVNRERWAVEETSIEQYIQGPKGAVEQTTVIDPIEKALVRLGQDVVQAFGRRLPAGYRVHCWAPTRAFLGKARMSLVSATIAYIKSGQTATQALDVDGTVSIRHIGPVPSFKVAVGLSASVADAGGAKLHADIGAAVRTGLQRIERAKSARLANLTSYQQRVLVISQRYRFADAGEVANQLASLPKLQGAFDAIFFYDTDIDLGGYYRTGGNPSGQIRGLWAPRMRDLL